MKVLWTSMCKPVKDLSHCMIPQIMRIWKKNFVTQLTPSDIFNKINVCTESHVINRFGKAARLHGHAIFGVVSVSDTGTGTTRRIPVSGECFFFFHFFDTAPTRLRHANTGKKKKKITNVWPLTFAQCHCPLSLAGARSGRSASSSSLLLLLLLLFIFLFLCSLT